MKQNFESIASYFLELASEQRLLILKELSKKPSRINTLAKKLEVTPQEIHRNLDRLAVAGMVKKGISDNYVITTPGNVMFSQTSMISFLTKNKKYFDSHNLEGLPTKFTRRLGVLEGCEHVKGVTAVLDRWRQIYTNSKEYVYDILSESPPEMMVPLVKRIKQGAIYHHIISKEFAEPENRESSLEKLGYYDFIAKGQIQRKEKNHVSIMLLANEKEAAIILPTTNDEPDLRHMFYGTGSGFHEWCLDYFEFVWKKTQKLSRVKPVKTRK